MSRNVALFSGCLLAACSGSHPGTVPQSPSTPEDPVQAASTTVEHSPSFENVTALGLAYSRAGRHAEAITAFERSRDISPGAPLAYNNLCAEHNSLGESDLAAEQCRKALELEPGFVLAKNNLAVAEQAKKGTMARIAGMKREINAGHDVDQNRVNIGMEYFHQGNNAAAVAVWRLVPEKSSLFAIAQNDLATALILLKQYAPARIALDNALRLQPHNDLFRNNERWLASKSKKSD